MLTSTASKTFGDDEHVQYLPYCKKTALESGTHWKAAQSWRCLLKLGWSHNQHELEQHV